MECCGESLWFAYLVSHLAGFGVCSQTNISAGHASGVSEGGSPVLPHPHLHHCWQEKTAAKAQRKEWYRVRNEQPRVGEDRMALLALVSAHLA